MIEIKCAYDKIVPLKDLKPHPKNPNKHSKEQITRLAQIIAYQGIRRPVRLSNQSGFITAGHGLVEALEYLGQKDAPVNLQDYQDEDQEYADIIADNAIAAWADLDLSSINLEVPNLGPDFDIKMLGLKDFEIEAADKYADKDADGVPEVKDAFVKLGDLYALGQHRLLCGDSTRSDLVERLMNGEPVHAVVTDPPYGIGLNYQSHDDSEDLWFQLMDKIVPILKRISPFVIMPCCRIKALAWWYKKHAPDWMVCWYKGSPGHRSAIGFNDWEPHLVWGRPKNPMHDYFQTRCGFEIDGHPCPKPVEYALWLVERAVEANENIFEPFCGSGTTLIACEKTNRRCFGMEIDPHYCSVIIERWQKFTGLTATKIE